MTMPYDKINKEKNTFPKGRLLTKYEKNFNHPNREQKNKEWQEENNDFIEEYNKRIAENGLFSDGLRSF